MTQRLLMRSGTLVGRWKLRQSQFCSLCLRHASKRSDNTTTTILYAKCKRNNARWIGSSTRVVRQEKSKKEELPPPAKEENETDDEVASWENPLHHNNPDYQPDKVFEEDFEAGEEIPKIPLPPLDDGSGKVQAAPHLHELADEIVNLTMLEMNDLINKIGDHFGFDDDEDDMMVGGGAGDAQGGDADEKPKEEEKTAFDLKLTGFDAKAKIKVIKEVRAIAGLGLKEAKEMVEGAPKVIKTGLKQEEAEELKKKLEEIGATVEIA